MPLKFLWKRQTRRYFLLETSFDISFSTFSNLLFTAIEHMTIFWPSGTENLKIHRILLLVLVQRILNQFQTTTTCLLKALLNPILTRTELFRSLWNLYPNPIKNQVGVVVMRKDSPPRTPPPTQFLAGHKRYWSGRVRTRKQGQRCRARDESSGSSCRWENIRTISIPSFPTFI